MVLYYMVQTSYRCNTVPETWIYRGNIERKFEKKYRLFEGIQDDLVSPSQVSLLSFLLPFSSFSFYHTPN